MKWSYLTSVAAAALLAGSAFAADVDLANKKEPPAPPPSWWDAVTITGSIDGGVTPNFAEPFNKLNFGRLFDDRAGAPTFNQAVLTIARPLDPKATGYDFGFKIQGLVGEDARYTHYLGELDYAIHTRTQIAPIEANALVHLPWVSPISEGGVDLKVGQFVTPLGAEVITAPDNPFYSHSYIFNYGPFMHTGVLVTNHVTSWLDVAAGVTTGENTSIGWPGDNNSSASILGAITLTLLDGSLVINAATHDGPENPMQTDPYMVGWPLGIVGGTPAACGCNPNTTWRYLNDINAVWKATDKLTFITDTAYYHDDGWNVNPFTGLAQGVSAYGIAQYATYKIDDIFKIGARLEIFRDNNNFFVGGFPGYFDNVNVQHGFADPSAIVAGPQNRGTTYLSLTTGVTITPEVPKNPYIANIILRPELRWDTTLNDTTPFAGGTKRSTVTFGFDAIVPFTLK
jgi:hypothetical protein